MKWHALAFLRIHNKMLVAREKDRKKAKGIKYRRKKLHKNKPTQWKLVYKSMEDQGENQFRFNVKNLHPFSG